MTQTYPSYNIENAVELTRLWVEKMVVGANLCPFAGSEVRREAIRYAVVGEPSLEGAITGFLKELLYLQERPEEELSTTLVIFTAGQNLFEDFLDFLDLAEGCIEQSGLDGLFQLASFHPHYCFEGVSEDDLSNWTNRSPFPVLHIIREGQMNRVLTSYKTPEDIPEGNIKLMQDLGREGLIKHYPPFADYWTEKENGWH